VRRRLLHRLPYKIVRMTEIVPTGPLVPAVLARVGELVADFERAMLVELSEIGLPSEGVLVSIDERRTVLANFQNAISLVEFEDRGRALYLSKFLAAIGAGLFDAALNYLWDETIAELRRRIASCDLAYFCGSCD
jgi:hypothetical protein